MDLMIFAIKIIWMKLKKNHENIIETVLYNDIIELMNNIIY